MAEKSSIQQRKSDHLAICRERDVEFHSKSSWLEHVELLHQALPSFSPREADLNVRFLGRDLAAPFLIGAMTGGTQEGGRINRALARVASEMGIGLALGSQRPMLEEPRLKATFAVRDVAPDILLLGNIGLSQAVALSPKRVVELMKSVGADGICLHLNAAMEMSQAEGDEPRGRSEGAIRRLAQALGERLIVKETGCGMARETAARLGRLGVRTLDVAGAGGTSWVRVENLRRGVPVGRDELEEWGIPTAASLIEVRSLSGAPRAPELRVIASGGLRSGMDLAKSIALGAQLGSAALPVLRVLHHAGEEGLRSWVAGMLAELRCVMVLCGCRDLAALRRAPVVLSGPLRNWAEQRRVRRSSRG